jgi:hypothetical protein
MDVKYFSSSSQLITGVSLDKALLKASGILNEKVIPRNKEYTKLKVKNAKDESKFNSHRGM